MGKAGKTILQNVKRLCRENGIALWKLEYKIGAGQGTLFKWVNRDPRVSTVKKVADYFSVTVDDLLKEAGDDSSDFGS